MVKILIIDDHAIVRAGICHFIESVPTMEVAGEAATADMAMRMVRAEDYHVILLDIGMPDKSGLVILAQIKREKPRTPVLILSMHPESRYAVQMLRNGAAGYVQKEALANELIHAIQTVVQGKKYISPAVAELLTAKTPQKGERPLHEMLSVREFDVFMRIANGEAATKTAEGLSLSIKTVSTYRTRILEKMNMTSNAEIIYYAIKNGLVD
ncbi:MAG TPA: response regulator transcription factor [Methylobacter sp.]